MNIYTPSHEHMYTQRFDVVPFFTVLMLILSLPFFVFGCDLMNLKLAIEDDLELFFFFFKSLTSASIASTSLVLGVLVLS